MGWYLPKTAPRESPFFCNTHPDFVRELASSAVDRIFMPGDCVVNEGHRPWTREDGWFGSNSKFPGGKLPWAWYNLEGGWNDEKECWGWFEIQNLKVNPETPPKQHWLSKHPSNHKDVFHFLGCVWHFGWRPLDSQDFFFACYFAARRVFDVRRSGQFHVHPLEWLGGCLCAWPQMKNRPPEVFPVAEISRERKWCCMVTTMIS